jgi:hypothetical protein
VPVIATVGYGVDFESVDANGGTVNGASASNLTKIGFQCISNGGGVSNAISNCNITNVTCNPAGTTCAVLLNTQNSSIRGANATGVAGHKAYLIEATGYMGNVTLANNTAASAGWSGIWVNGYTNGTPLIFTGNTSTGGCTQTGGAGADIYMQDANGGSGGGALKYLNNTAGTSSGLCNEALYVQGFGPTTLIGGFSINPLKALFMKSLTGPAFLDFMTLNFGTGTGIQATSSTATINNHNVFTGSGTQLSNSGSTITDRRGIQDSVLP